jgi:hypothetical protein
MEEDENLGIHTRLASSLKWGRVVHATFFSSFYMRSSVYYKKQSIERETDSEREREEKMRVV